MKALLLLPILLVIGCSSLQRSDRYLLAKSNIQNGSKDTSHCVEVMNNGHRYELSPIRTNHIVAVGIPIVPLIPSPVSHKNFSLRITPLSEDDSSKIQPSEWALRIGTSLIKPIQERAQSDLISGGSEAILTFPEQKESFERFYLVTQWKDKSGKNIEIEFNHKFGSLEYHPFFSMSAQEKCTVSKI